MIKHETLKTTTLCPLCGEPLPEGTYDCGTLSVTCPKCGIHVKENYSSSLDEAGNLKSKVIDVGIIAPEYNYFTSASLYDDRNNVSNASAIKLTYSMVGLYPIYKETIYPFDHEALPEDCLNYAVIVFKTIDQIYKRYQPSRIEEEITSLIDAAAKKLSKPEVPVSVPGSPCVVISHSFDMDVAVYECDTDDEANDTLEELYKQYYNEEIENNSSLNEEETALYKEDGWGKITWSDGDYTRFVQAYTIKNV